MFDEIWELSDSVLAADTFYGPENSMDFIKIVHVNTFCAQRKTNNIIQSFFSLPVQSEEYS